jgi:hypothetical protein
MASWRLGIAMLTRTVFIESEGRYERLFKVNPPSRVAQFAERVPMVEGRLDREITTATAYAWLVWEKDRLGSCELFWIPPCRKKLERDEDYDLPTKMWSRRYRGPIIAPSIAPSGHFNEDRIVVTARPSTSS